MNFLFWAFLGGTAAVVFPLLFHLIRRTPRHQQEFSSLMFLNPSPPRLTRRRRLDNVLLLVLRSLAIVLLAVAFMRPLWRDAAQLSLSGTRGRRVALMLDTSASMRRGNLWQQALNRVETLFDQLEPVDDVALFTFDRTVQTIVGFDQPADVAPGRKSVLVRSRLNELSPTWAPTDLASALLRATEELEARDDEPSPVARQSVARQSVARQSVARQSVAQQIVVISDMQHGSRLDSLQSFEWPSQVRVAIEQVSLDDNSNAGLQLLTSDDEPDSSGTFRIRVTNSADSNVDQFFTQWSGQGTRPEGDQEVAFYVPPGQSRVLQVPRGPQLLTADRLILSGDAAVFDNVHFVIPAQQELLRLTYLGKDNVNDPEGALYYLKRALGETPARQVVITSHSSDSTPMLIEGELPELIVITCPLSPPQRETVQSYVDSGGDALVVLEDRDMVASLSGLLTNVNPESDPASSGDNDYRMLGDIDFSHPLFAPFAHPRYNDFTDIRFWKYCPVAIRGNDEDGEDGEDEDAVDVVARFDNGRPALWEQRHGDGRLFVLTSGWQPRHSQMALSNKFVPLLETLLELCLDRRLQSAAYLVGEAVPLPAAPAGTRRTVLRPDGSESPISDDAEAFQGTDEPGIYRLQMGHVEQSFAVNLDRSESDTMPLEIEQLEQLGVKLGTQATQWEEYERLRQLLDVELEGRQKLWKWFLVAALAVVGMETWLAGWRTRQSFHDSGSVT